MFRYLGNRKMNKQITLTILTAFLIIGFMTTAMAVQQIVKTNIEVSVDNYTLKIKGEGLEWQTNISSGNLSKQTLTLEMIKHIKNETISDEILDALKNCTNINFKLHECWENLGACKDVENRNYLDKCEETIAEYEQYKIDNSENWGKFQSCDTSLTICENARKSNGTNIIVAVGVTIFLIGLLVWFLRKKKVITDEGKIIVKKPTQKSGKDDMEGM